MESQDGGQKWQETDDPTIPFNWPSFPHPEINRINGVMPDGSYVNTGIVRLDVWPINRYEEAETRGIIDDEYPSDSKNIVVRPNEILVVRSVDNGTT